MKMFFAVAVLATTIASPVFAQSPARRAPAPAINPAYQVYEGGQYLGSDPDLNVRFALRRDYFGHD